jgi:hypothetical protein
MDDSIRFNNVQLMKIDKEFQLNLLYWSHSEKGNIFLRYEPQGLSCKFEGK